jgi:hypothetical protein
VEGEPVSGKEVEFAIAGSSFTARTDASGAASTVADVPDHGRSTVVTARFAGDEEFEESQATATITWGRSRN